jgi:hypothetical protein
VHLYSIQRHDQQLPSSESDDNQNTTPVDALTHGRGGGDPWKHQLLTAALACLPYNQRFTVTVYTHIRGSPGAVLTRR